MVLERPQYLLDRAIERREEPVRFAVDRFGIGRIVEQGSRLPCDFNLRVTHWNRTGPSPWTMVVDQAEAVVATSMTLAERHIRSAARSLPLALPVIVYAQTGVAVERAFLRSGVTGLCTEPFPFSPFSAEPTVFLYRSACWSARVTLLRRLLALAPSLRWRLLGVIVLLLAVSATYVLQAMLIAALGPPPATRRQPPVGVRAPTYDIATKVHLPS